MVEILRLYYSQDRRKYLFLLDGRARFDVVNDRRFNKITFFVFAFSAGDDLASFVDAFFNILKRFFVCAVVYYRR